MTEFRGLLATIVGMALPVCTLMLYQSRNKRRQLADGYSEEAEQRRASQLAYRTGSIVLSLVQFVAGLTALIPVLALTMAIVGGERLPNIETVLILAAMFVGGWCVFMWAVRITDALKD
jgi:hypothetical protein